MIPVDFRSLGYDHWSDIDPRIDRRIPLYTQTVDIPREFTADGRQYRVRLTWMDGEIMPFDANNPRLKLMNYWLPAKLETYDVEYQSWGRNIPLKQLDVNSGFGPDMKGLLVAQFKYPTLNGDGKFEIRLIPGVLDAHFNQKTRDYAGKNTADELEHQFVYLPVKGPGEKWWLNNNLGADYSNLNSPHFDFTKQAENWNDGHAAGSLFQWARLADGHELMSYDNASRPVSKYSSTTDFANSIMPLSNMIYLGPTNGVQSWIQNSLNNLPQFGIGDMYARSVSS